MTVNCNLNESDYRAMRRYFMFRYRKMHWVVGIVLISVLVFVWFSNKPGATTVEKIASVVGVAIVWVILLFVFSLAWKIVSRFTGGRFRGSVGPHVFEIDENRVTESNAEGRKEITLAGIRHAGETSSHFFIFTRAGSAFVIPKRDLQSHDALRDLQKRVAASGA